MLENMCVLAGISCVFCWNLLNDYGLKLMVSKCDLYAGKYVCVVLEIHVFICWKICVCWLEFRVFC